MKVGVQFLLTATDRAISCARHFDEMFSVVAHAQDHGYDGIWIAEHPHARGGCVPNPLILLARASDIAPSLRLGIARLALPLFNPVRLVEDIATLDVASAGRVDLEIGCGEHSGQPASAGDDVSTGVAQLEESLMVLRTAFAQSGFSRQDRFWQAAQTTVAPEPPQLPHPPIWMEASSRQAIRAAVTRGYHVRVGGPARLDELARRTAHIDSVARDVGIAVTRVERATSRFVFCSDHPREVREAVACSRRSERAARRFARPAGSMGERNVGSVARAGADTEDWREHVIIGDPEECIRRIRELAAAGITYVQGRFQFGGIDQGTARRSVERFSVEVMPAVADLQTSFSDAA